MTRPTLRSRDGMMIPLPVHRKPSVYAREAALVVVLLLIAGLLSAWVVMA